MLAKKTTKNQITVPKTLVVLFPDAMYFDVRMEEGRIVLVPMRPGRAYEVWPTASIRPGASDV